MVVNNKFDLDDDDHYAISIAINAAHAFLRNEKITPKQIIGLGNALYALERMPDQTEGAYCEYGITYRHGNDDYDETRYITFTISEDIFAISDGGSSYERTIGSDSYSNPGWRIEIDGDKETEAQLYDLESSIQEYLNLGAEIDVADNSEIEIE